MIPRQKWDKRKWSQEQIHSLCLRQKPFYKKSRKKMNSAKIDLASISERKWTEENWEKKGWKLGDNPDTFADNLRTSIFRLKLKQLKQPCPVWENRFCDVMVQGMSSDAWDEFSKTILERCLIISLWNPLLGSLCVIKKDLCIPCGGLFRLSTCPSTCSRSLFFTAAHFQLALVAASICHFVTAATKFSCCSAPTKNVSFVFFVCLFVRFFYLSL